MLKWQKENSIPVDKARGMKPEELEGKIVTGIFAEEKRPEYVEEYYRLVARVKEKNSDNV